MSKESSSGFGIGSLIAGIVSWVHWHSIGWCILHTILGWFYLIYYVIKYGLH